MVKTRFAPSPTGFLHIGGARTCLFSWLYARANKGEFVLRIEDTDRVRSKQEYLDEILESLQWLGLDWDEIHYQSRRFNLYKKYAEELVGNNKAFRKEGAIFFKYEYKDIQITDLIRKKIVFTELPKEEEVIIKSDGSPTYNFSCVIDDALMGITHVIRGDDHIPNTPKQILMYQALGFSVPEFAHVPLILSEEGGRLSKRFGATSLREYKEDGYLPEAVVNYLLLLGWSPGQNQEIISLAQARDKFDIRDVNDTAASFSMDKLNWTDSYYIKNKIENGFVEELYKPAVKILQKEGIPVDDFDKEYILAVIDLFKERLSKLSDLLIRADFCFGDGFSYNEETAVILQRKLPAQIKKLRDTLQNLEKFDKDIIEREFRRVCGELGLKAKDLVHPTRVALTGKKAGPGLFETMQVLGKDRVLQRLDRLINYWG